MRASDFLSLVKGVRKQSKGWVALCPAHDDKKASLSISEGEKGLLLKCFVGCSSFAICEALGLKERDLFYESLSPKKEWQRYPIQDVQGRLVAVRKRKGSGEAKKMAWEQPNGKSGLNGVKVVDLPLFGSEHLLTFDRSRWVELCEGEAKTQALQALGAQAVGTSTGASSVPSRKVLESLRGFRVRLWPDNDEPGRLHMQRIAAELRALGVECVVLNTRSLPPKGDAVQWIEGQLREGRTKTQLRELLFGDELPGLPRETQQAPNTQPTPPNSDPTGTQHPANDPFSDIPTFTLEELLALDIPERASLCGPFVENSISMLFAPTGIGKSWLAEGLALAVATGTPFLKWETPRPRTVLLVDGELHTKDFQNRFLKMMKANGKKTEGRLKAILANQSPSGTLPDLRTEAGQAFIESRLDGVDFLILDSRSTLFRYQDENDSASWQEVQDWLQKIRKRCAILLIHHANKAGQQRGTSALEVLPELILKLDRPADYHPTQGARFKLEYTKARNLTGEEAGEFECCLEPDESGEGLLWTWSPISGGKKALIVEKLKEHPELGVRAIARAVGADPGYVSQVKKQYQASLGVGEGGVVVGSLENRTQQHPPSPFPQSKATTQQTPNTDPTPQRESSLLTGESRRERPNTDPTLTQHPLPTTKSREAAGTQQGPNTPQRSMFNGSLATHIGKPRQE